MARNLNKDVHRNSSYKELANIKNLCIGSEYFTEEFEENETLIENLDNQDPKIFKIPQTIINLINLQKVSIKYSKLNNLDKVFFDFKNLKEIF
jgi:hypothetical protein